MKYGSEPPVVIHESVSPANADTTTGGSMKPHDENRMILLRPGLTETQPDVGVYPEQISEAVRGGRANHDIFHLYCAASSLKNQKVIHFLTLQVNYD